MAVDPLKKGTVGGKTPSALQMPGQVAGGRPDLSLVTNLPSTKKYTLKPSVVPKGSEVEVQTSSRTVPFQSVMLQIKKGGSKTIGALDIRNAWMFDELRESGKLRTLILSYDDVTKESILSFHGTRRCYEKGLARGNRVDPDDIEREGLEWMRENNITVWELARREVVHHEDGTEEIIWPGYDPNVPATATEIIRETGRILDEAYRVNRPHILIMDHLQPFYERIGTSHVYNMIGKPPNTQVPQQHWQHRTTPMSIIKAAMFTLPTMAVVATGYPGEVEPIITNRQGEEVYGLQYREPRWVLFFQKDFNLDIQGEFKEPVGPKGQPLRDGTKGTYEWWVRNSQTSLVEKGITADVTGGGLSTIYNMRRPKKSKEEKKP